MLIASKWRIFTGSIGTKIIQKRNKFVSKMAFSQKNYLLKLFCFCDTKLEVVAVTNRICLYKELTIQNTNVAIVSVAQYPSITNSPKIYNFNLSSISIAIK